MKLFKGEDRTRWLLLNIRSEIGYKLGLFKQMPICTENVSTSGLRRRVRIALQGEWERRLKETEIWEGTKPVIVDVSALLNRLMREEQERVEASATEIKKRGKQVWDAFRNEVRESDKLSWIGKPKIEDCKILVPLVELVIHACMVATGRNQCRTDLNMEHLVQTVADFTLFWEHFEKTAWPHILKRTLPPGEKRHYIDLNIDGMRSNTAKLCVPSELCGPAGEAPALQMLRDLVASSPNVHTTRDAIAMVELYFSLSCKAFGVEQLILPGMISLPSQ